jgi:manganese/zinc/iron transport system substrate-binding protein
MKALPLCVLFAAILAGCQPPDASSTSAANSPDSFRGEYPIRAIATVGMVADIVRSVGGEHVAVTQIMGTGVDPHLYKPTRDDVQTIRGGNLVFYSGLMLEGKMTDTLIKIAGSKPVIAVTELIDEAELLEPEDFQGHYDPHVWMDVSAWSKCVQAVAKALADFDPSHAEAYEENAQAYRAELAKLHEYGLTSIGSIPQESRVLITSHDAFNYFGRAYGLEVQGVQGISTESEAGLQRVNALVDLIVDKKVPAVFVESSVPRKNIEALVEGARARGHTVTIGGELFSDAMGETGTYEGTYIGMLDHNITLVTTSLGGSAPAAGMQGKLSHASEPGE